MKRRSAASSSASWVKRCWSAVGCSPRTHEHRLARRHGTSPEGVDRARARARSDDHERPRVRHRPHAACASARLSSRTFTRSCPRNPRAGPSVCSSISDPDLLDREPSHLRDARRLEFRRRDRDVRVQTARRGREEVCRDVGDGQTRVVRTFELEDRVGPLGDLVRELLGVRSRGSSRRTSRRRSRSPRAGRGTTPRPPTADRSTSSRRPCRPRWMRDPSALPDMVSCAIPVITSGYARPVSRARTTTARRARKALGITGTSPPRGACR